MKALSAIFFVAVSCYLHAQTPTGFETASINGNADDRGRVVDYSLDGVFNVGSCPLETIIRSLYNVRGFQIVNAPNWIDEGYVGVYGKAAAPANEDQLKLMAQRLLAECFQLQVHRELRNMSVYALKVTRGGPKGVAKDSGQSRGSGRVFAEGTGRRAGTNVSMPLAAAIRVDRPMIDKTNFPGAIDFDLRYAGQSIFAVIEAQPGLILRPETAAVDVLVIDNVQPPSEN